MCLILNEVGNAFVIICTDVTYTLPYYGGVLGLRHFRGDQADLRPIYILYYKWIYVH